MNNIFLRSVIILGMSLVFLSLPGIVSAEQWYDKLPKSGEYTALPEPNTTSVPKDFESVNVPASEGGDDQISPSRSDSSSSNIDEGELENKPVGKTLMWWVVGVVGLIIILLITAPFWLKRVFSKMSP